MNDSAAQILPPLYGQGQLADGEQGGEGWIELRALCLALTSPPLTASRSSPPHEGEGWAHA
jgi:hypothetical protein